MEYESVAPAIAMATVIVVWLVDFFGSRYVSQTNNNFHNPSLTAVCRSHVRIRACQRVIETSRLLLPHPPKAGGGKIDDISTPMTELACCGPNKSEVTPFDGAAKTAHWNVQLLEYGVIFHSIMIGAYR